MRLALLPVLGSGWPALAAGQSVRAGSAVKASSGAQASSGVQESSAENEPARSRATGGAIEQFAHPGLVVGAKLGLGTGAPTNDFGLSYGGVVELGYLLPLPAPVLHAIELFVSAGYEQSSLSGETAGGDARLSSDAAASFKIDERALPLSLGVRGRIPLSSRWLAPYVALGYRGYALSDVTRTRLGGVQLEDQTEHSFVHGGFGSVGLELFLGPGALLGEVELSWAPRSEYVLRDAAVGGMRVFLGYRFMIGPGPASRATAQHAGGTRTDASQQPTATASERELASEQETQESSPSAAAPNAASLASESEAPLPSAEESASLRGQIRGNVRSFEGEPLRATIVVKPGDLRAQTSQDGKFSLEVEPGSYKVSLRAPGYAPQTRRIVVDEDGITVLNVELRDK